MTDSGIELEYEERLKAEQPKLLLYVDGSPKGDVEPDTPAGRRRIEKAAFEALVKSDDVKVVPIRSGDRVVPEGVSGSDRAGTRPEHAGGSVSAVELPALTRTPSRATGCCVPEVYAGPSGVRRRHAWNCETSPGGVFEGTVLDIKRARLSAKHRAETLHRGLDEAITDHPAQGVLMATGPECPAHPLSDVDGCPTCNDRRL
jgi:hypothetical protein